MIQCSKQTDERRQVTTNREAETTECWLLHGALGAVADWRGFAKCLADEKTGSRAVDLWRFLENQALPLPDFGRELNEEAAGEVFRGKGRALLGYSLGGRLALHALLGGAHVWQAAVVVSAHPGLESAADRDARRTADAAWATRAIAGNWQEFVTAWNAQPVFNHAPPRDPQQAARLIHRRREIAQSFVDWSLGAQQPLWDRLPEITIPVLWVAGENDPNFRDLAERAAARMPRATLAIAPAAGHRVPWESEEWLARQVGAFLRGG